ncbi:hypothetical protein BJ508DRAFT_330717 [Ascobolus immersus RN42]|uniref:Uncharacterized protein n=1 Tax=Ascobolus immersus RN42 TaxID=1160509 RepID=A0A3N4HU62_ASCIM|nr:hypothetical protein BJ508DRAFT_330717 [Ascobolus immersus RN42]
MSGASKCLSHDTAVDNLVGNVTRKEKRSEVGNSRLDEELLRRDRRVEEERANDNTITSQIHHKLSLSGEKNTLARTSLLLSSNRTPPSSRPSLLDLDESLITHFASLEPPIGLFEAIRSPTPPYRDSPFSVTPPHQTNLPGHYPLSSPQNDLETPPVTDTPQPEPEPSSARPWTPDLTQEEIKRELYDTISPTIFREFQEAVQEALSSKPSLFYNFPEEDKDDTEDNYIKQEFNYSNLFAESNSLRNHPNDSIKFDLSTEFASLLDKELTEAPEKHERRSITDLELTPARAPPDRDGIPRNESPSPDSDRDTSPDPVCPSPTPGDTSPDPDPTPPPPDTPPLSAEMPTAFPKNVSLKHLYKFKGNENNELKSLDTSFRSICTSQSLPCYYGGTVLSDEDKSYTYVNAGTTNAKSNYAFGTRTMAAVMNTFSSDSNSHRWFVDYQDDKTNPAPNCWKKATRDTGIVEDNDTSNNNNKRNNDSSTNKANANSRASGSSTTTTAKPSSSQADSKKKKDQPKDAEAGKSKWPCKRCWKVGHNSVDCHAPALVAKEVAQAQEEEAKKAKENKEKKKDSVAGVACTTTPPSPRLEVTLLWHSPHP